jgi:hypothetical protein
MIGALVPEAVALAFVMVSLVAQHGVDYLFAAVVLMGVLQHFGAVRRMRGRFPACDSASNYYSEKTTY